MLGIRTNRKPVSGAFASTMLHSLKRANMGELNENEKRILQKEKELSKEYSATWL